MFDGWVKIAVKGAIIAGMLGALVAVLVGISLPAVDFSVLQGYINSVYTFAIHWCPIIAPLYNTALFILGANAAILAFRVLLFTGNAILKVFE